MSTCQLSRRYTVDAALFWNIAQYKIIRKRFTLETMDIYFRLHCFCPLENGCVDGEEMVRCAFVIHLIDRLLQRVAEPKLIVGYVAILF